jgi:hypothetical protein
MICQIFGWFEVKSLFFSQIDALYFDMIFCFLGTLEVVGIGFHSCNSITCGTVGKHLAIEVGSISCNALFNYHCSLNWEKPIGGFNYQAKIWQLCSKKLPCLQAKKITLV